MNDIKNKMRICLLYDFKQRKTAAESHRSISNAFGEDVINKRQCRNWFQRFRDGDESLEDKEHERRPKTVDDEELKAAIDSDPAQTTRELAEWFGCHHSTIADHLHAIGKVNKCGKWVPHELSDLNKTTRINMAGILLRQAKNSGFFESIVTSDEKWISFDNTTRKRQWLDPGQTPKPTPKADIHGKKVMLCVWWNSKGLVHFEVLNSG